MMCCAACLCMDDQDEMTTPLQPHLISLHLRLQGL